MSGGSYDYAYHRVNDFIDKLEANDTNQERKQFIKLLKLVSKAMHDIEWVDSGDCSEGDEIKAINRCLSFKKEAV